MLPYERESVSAEDHWAHWPSAELLEVAHRYTVCNGISNQLLGHAANIAYAIKTRRPVLIPNGLIINGVQEEKDEHGGLLDAVMTQANSVRLSAVLNTAALIQIIKSHGIEAHLLPRNMSIHSGLRCSWLEDLQGADTDIVVQILLALLPVARIQRLAEKVFEVAGKANAISSGVCVHHRDGIDWYKHCRQWENIPDGVWRRNCMEDVGTTIVQQLERRTSHLPTEGFWIYYVGDHAVPESFKTRWGAHNVVHRPELAEMDEASLVAGLVRRKGPARDLGALVDSTVCSMLPHFVGNSVSTWSAVQIVKRNGMASWYNSRSVPLAEVFRSYYIPVVYTFTEESDLAGLALLKTSILSVKQNMPRAAIHVLYHGVNNTVFRGWLRLHGVTVHDHRPEWREKIEAMRTFGDAQMSHLYASSGNYFGTWQRIDIPKHIDAEYCLFLDSDTVVLASFTLQDFGLEITPTIALSAEMDEEDPRPWNAGVAVLNIPFMRSTLEDLHKFIFVDHPDGRFANGPSDQGAMNDFYGPSKTFLSRTFNVKPYWKNLDTWGARKIIHWHGMKPVDAFLASLQEPCSPAIDSLCKNVWNQPFLCPSLRIFARAALLEGPAIIDLYCRSSFPGPEQKGKAATCVQFFTDLAAGADDRLLCKTDHTLGAQF